MRESSNCVSGAVRNRNCKCGLICPDEKSMLPVVAGPALGGWLSLKADCHCISVGSKKIMKFIITKLVPLIEIDLKGAKSPLKLIQSVAGWEQWSVSHTKNYRCLIQSLHCHTVANFSRGNLVR